MSQKLLMTYSTLAVSSDSKLCLRSYRVNTCVLESLGSYEEAIPIGTITCLGGDWTHLQVIPCLRMQF